MRVQVRLTETIPSLIIANHGVAHKMRKMMEMREIGIFYSTLAPKTELPLEVHGFLEVIYRIKGRSRMTYGDKEGILEPNAYALIPAGVWHQTTSLETETYTEQLVLCAYGQEAGSFLENVCKSKTMICHQPTKGESKNVY